MYGILLASVLFTAPATAVKKCNHKAYMTSGIVCWDQVYDLNLKDYSDEDVFNTLKDLQSLQNTVELWQCARDGKLKAEYAKDGDQRFNKRFRATLSDECVLSISKDFEKLPIVK